MKKTISPAIVFACALAILLTLPFYVHAQDPQFEPAPNEIKSKFNDRQKRIKQELKSLPGNEWAGEYWAQEDLINNAIFVWSLSGGFTVRSGNEFHRGFERVNYGDLNFNGNSLILTPENLENNKFTYRISTSLIPVKWDKQHWLIPSDELILFIYAVNSGDYDAIHSYFVKDEDTGKSNRGLPDVPKEYRKYLNLKPIITKVTDVKVNNITYGDFTLTLNAGKSEGVITGMRFYLVKVKNVLLWVRVTDVWEHTAAARVMSTGSSGNYNKEIKPEIGWEFTSTIPKYY